MFFCACFGTLRTCVIELRTNSEILSEILIMTRKSNSNPSAKSLQEENEALKKEIESLKSEFKRIPVNLLSYVFNVTFICSIPFMQLNIFI